MPLEQGIEQVPELQIDTEGAWLSGGHREALRLTKSPAQSMCKQMKQNQGPSSLSKPLMLSAGSSESWVTAPLEACPCLSAEPREQVRSEILPSSARVSSLPLVTRAALVLVQSQTHVCR